MARISVLHHALPVFAATCALAGCGGGGGKKSPAAVDPGSGGPTIALLPGMISGTSATVVIPLQATGSGPLTTVWRFASGTGSVLVGTPALDGRTVMYFARNGTWRATARVSDSRGSSERDVTIEVTAPVQPALAGQVLDGSALTPAPGVVWSAVWTPIPGATLAVASGATGSDGRWRADALIAPLEQVAVTVR
ncbi:MAG: hypothetical protein RLZZ127_634 [Planctomycetota bacterium]|jgi:hypothetical protein